jgi:hypothetical protein
MNEDRIREIAKQASAHAEATVPPHWDIEDGLDYSAKMMKVRDLKFAELIVRDCISIAHDYEAELIKAKISDWKGAGMIAYKISRQFGVKE